MVLHCNLRPKGGLANIRVSQASTKAWALVGGDSKAMSDRLSDGDSLDTYLWGRGHCAVSPPGELLYVGESVGTVITNDNKHYDRTQFVRSE